MDEAEKLEDTLYPATLVKNVLGMDLEAFERYRKGATKGLIKFGGSFAYHLGITLQHADLANSVKILNIWQRECSEHEMLYRIWKAKQDAMDKLNGENVPTQDH